MMTEKKDHCRNGLGVVSVGTFSRLDFVLLTNKGRPRFMMSNSQTKAELEPQEKRGNKATQAQLMPEIIKPCELYTCVSEDLSHKHVVEEYPQGYPALAAFTSSDPNFAIFRKFGWLHHRVLLYKQDEIATLERALERLDKKDFQENKDWLGSRDMDDERQDSQRRDLILDISERLKEYGKLCCLVLNFLYIAKL